MGLDTVELAMAVESEFDLIIPDAVAPTLERLIDIREFVSQILGARDQMVDASDVWDRMTSILQRDFAKPEQYLLPEAHLAHDLGLD